jgi:phosphoribosylformylglycinamidine cyclo-ligase
MVVVIAADQAEACAATLRQQGEQVFTIGCIAPRGDAAAVTVA